MSNTFAPLERHCVAPTHAEAILGCNLVAMKMDVPHDVVVGMVGVSILRRSGGDNHELKCVGNIWRGC